MRAPLEGRRIWFVGIGGAGLSAYAAIASAWGAEVGGWDRVETPYLEHVREHEIVIAPEPVVPDGWEVVVSSAYPDVAGTPRAEFLAELVSLRDSIVVAGAHGKTTTSGMIAFVLDRLGPRSRVRDRRRDPAAREQCAARARAGSSSRATSPTGRSRRCGPKIAVVLNVDLDHHAEFASLAEVQLLFDEWTAHVPNVVRAEELEPVDFALALPGEHNRRNAAAALAALELAGVSRAEAAPVLAEFTGAGRRFELRGEAGGTLVYDDYAHHPAEIDAVLRAARELGRGRVLVLFQPHLYSRTRHLAQEFGSALARADVVVVADVYAAREQPLDGVTRQARRRRDDASAAGDARGMDARRRGRRALARAARASRRRRVDGRRRRCRPRRARPAGGASVTIEENVLLVAVHDARHRRPGALVRAPGVDGRAGACASLRERSRNRRRGRRPRLEPARRRRGCRAARSQARRRARAGRGRRRADRRGRRRVERRDPPSRARRRSRRVRVRVRDSRDDRRRRLDERGRLRRRHRAGARRGPSSSRRKARAGSRRRSSASRTGIPTCAHGQVVALAELSLSSRPVVAIQRDDRRAAGSAQGRPADEQADVRQRLQEP